MDYWYAVYSKLQPTGAARGRVLSSRSSHVFGAGLWSARGRADRFVNVLRHDGWGDNAAVLRPTAGKPCRRTECTAGVAAPHTSNPDLNSAPLSNYTFCGPL